MGQNYKNNLNLLSEFLGYLKYKVDNNLLTLDEVQGLQHLLFDGLRLSGSAEDIADFYHRTPEDVRNVIHRKMFSKPVRKVHYDFKEFQKVVPEKWRE